MQLTNLLVWLMECAHNMHGVTEWQCFKAEYCQNTAIWIHSHSVLTTIFQVNLG